MAIPKSVTKVSKSGVTYTSSVDRAAYTIQELTRAALRDIAKLVTKRFREAYYNKFQKHTGKAGRVTKYKVWASKNTKYPRVEIGLKTGRAEGFYAYFQEFGAKGGSIPRLEILRTTVYDNIPTIVEIESQYLSGLEDEAAALNMIDEAEYEGGDKDE